MFNWNGKRVDVFASSERAAIKKVTGRDPKKTLMGWLGYTEKQKGPNGDDIGSVAVPVKVSLG